MAEDDEELEILPHIKGSTDFEIYESVVIKPRETILAWDASKSPSYELTYTASGGGKGYAWTTSNSSMATVDAEGKVTTHGGPGTFTVRVAMVKGQQVRSSLENSAWIEMVQPRFLDIPTEYTRPWVQP